MADRGRKSAASLAVVTALPGQRPEPPDELSDAEAAVWRAVAATKPADWFGADTHPLLAAYCRHACAARAMSAAVHAFPVADCADPERAKHYNLLLIMRERETCAMHSLARGMRITQQSRYDAKTANTAASKAGGPSKPWEFGT